jgi:outer membrane protein assembly factor BamB
MVSGTPTIFIGGGNTSVGGGHVYMYAVNAATDTYFWRDCLSASVLGTMMATPFAYTDSSSHSLFWGAPAVANGWLYTSNMDGTFYAFH